MKIFEVPYRIKRFFKGDSKQFRKLEYHSKIYYKFYLSNNPILHQVKWSIWAQQARCSKLEWYHLVPDEMILRLLGMIS